MPGQASATQPETPAAKAQNGTQVLTLFEPRRPSRDTRHRREITQENILQGLQESTEIDMSEITSMKRQTG